MATNYMVAGTGLAQERRKTLPDILRQVCSAFESVLVDATLYDSVD